MGEAGTELDVTNVGGQGEEDAPLISKPGGINAFTCICLYCFIELFFVLFCEVAVLPVNLTFYRCLSMNYYFFLIGDNFELRLHSFFSGEQFDFLRALK